MSRCAPVLDFQVIGDGEVKFRSCSVTVKVSFKMSFNMSPLVSVNAARAQPRRHREHGQFPQPFEQTQDVDYAHLIIDLKHY